MIFFCRTGIKIPAKPDKKSTKKIFKKPRKPLNNLMKKISGNYWSKISSSRQLLFFASHAFFHEKTDIK